MKLKRNTCFTISWLHPFLINTSLPGRDSLAPPPFPLTSFLPVSPSSNNRNHTISIFILSEWTFLNILGRVIQWVIKITGISKLWYSHWGWGARGRKVELWGEKKKKKKKENSCSGYVLIFILVFFFLPYKIPAAISVRTIFNSIRHSMSTFFLMQCGKAHL